MTRRLALFVFLAYALSACAGSNFTGTGSAQGESQSAKTGKRGPKDRSEDQSKDGKDGKDVNDSKDDKGGSGEADGDGKDGKDSDGGDLTDQAGGSDADADNQADGKLTEEDEELIKKLPGVDVTKVGVNFEDRPVRAKDIDYNDAVLCFEGKFKVDGRNVVSIAKQRVVGTTFSNAGCSHLITVQITHKNGKKESPISYDSKSTTPVEMPFKVGSKLDVSMVVISGDCTGGTMHDTVHAQVAPNLCNNH